LIAPRPILFPKRLTPTWSSGWVLLVCEWRRWRRLGMSRLAVLCILLTSLHRIH